MTHGKVPGFQPFSCEAMFGEGTGTQAVNYSL